MSDFFNLGNVDDYIKQYGSKPSVVLTYDSALTSCIQEIVGKLERNELLGLELNEAQLKSEHARLLATGLARNTSLQILCLSYNDKLSDRDVSEILGSIINHPKLLVLEISDIGFSAEMCGNLAYFIQHNKNLLYLDISGDKNRLDDHGITAIAQSLLINRTLLGLKFLNAYRLDSFHATELLIDNLTRNESLSFLSISGLSVEQDRRVNAAIANNRRLCQYGIEIPDMLFNYLHKARGFVWDIIQRNGSEIPILEILKMVNRNFKRLQAAANKENVLPLVLLFSPQNTVSTHEVAKSPSSEVHTRPGILREISQNISLISK